MNVLIAALMLAAGTLYQATSALAPAVRDLSPSPGTSVKAFFPRLSATIDVRGGNPLSKSSLHLYLDGREVTASAKMTGDTLQYVPRERMQAGWHDAFLEGSDTANRTFSQAWVFRTQDPDVDLPVGDDGGFAFSPAGASGAPFTHFFLLSPFDGFGFVQFCGLQFPMTRVIGTPVFFVTVPVTLGTALLGCNPGIVFAPFQAGIGQFSPIFFPIEVAGPGFFQNGGAHGPRRPLTTTGSTVMPVYRAQPAMPVYRAQPAMPVYSVPHVTVPRVPVRCCPRAR